VATSERTADAGIRAQRRPGRRTGPSADGHGVRDAAHDGRGAEPLAALERARRVLVTRRAEVRDVLTQVATYRASDYEIDAAIDTLDGAAREVATHRPRRLHAAAVFLPSNVLLYSYVLYALVPSLFVDRIALRPAAAVRAHSARLHELLAPAHGLPVDLRLVSQRAFLRDDVAGADLVVFTGRAANAEEIGGQLRPEQLMLFFGMGANPFIVTARADLSLAARDLVDIRMFNSGQDCLAPDAVFLHRSVAERFVGELTGRLRRLRYGLGGDPVADYGPLFYERAFEDATRYLLKRRRQVRYGGSTDVRTMRIDPVVLVRELCDATDLTELFSPVFNLLVYDDDADLKATLAHNSFSERALGASVYGGDDDLVEHVARKHTVTCDETLLAVDQGNRPFGGRGRMANQTIHGGCVICEPILVSQSVARHIGTRP
jgi:aldehyde dehydrogenase (NAD+)